MQFHWNLQVTLIIINTNADACFQMVATYWLATSKKKEEEEKKTSPA